MDGVLFNKAQTTLVRCPGGKAGSFTIPNSVTSIEKCAFSDCTNLTSVTIPISVTWIGERAFSDCSSLTRATIPASVTWIGDRAFTDCTSLTNITIPIGVTWIGNYAFWNCQELSAIKVDPLNAVYGSVDGVLFNKAQTTLIQCPVGKAGSFTIPNSVTSIGSSAFRDCTNLTNVTIGSNVTTIEDEAFVGCTSLTNVTIPNRVTTIGGCAFQGCTSLSNVTIGNSVTSIEHLAFWDCNLKGVYFKGNAPSIGLDVFRYARKVTVYYLPGTRGWEKTFGDRPTALWKP